jgi:hypothetical protein
MSRAGLLLQHTRLGLHFSLANFDNLVTKCSSNLLEGLVPCLPVYRISVCLGLGMLLDRCREWLMLIGLGLGLAHGK